MKKTTKTKIAALLFATVFFCGSAAAEIATPTPKAYSNVIGENIVLGDVFENVGGKADFYLAPAPEVGKTRIIGFNDLMRISTKLNLGWEPENEGQQTIIRRTANVIGAHDIESALKIKLRETLGNKEFDVTLTNKSTAFNIAENSDKTISIENMDFDAAKMALTAKVTVGAKVENTKEVRALVSYIHSVPVLSESKHKGDVISENDIQFIKMKTSDITANMVTDVTNLIGKTPRNNLTAMEPVYESDLKLPNLIKKGDVVIMKLESPLISLTTQGYAAQDGKQGDLIRVENITSKQIITAIVTGEREVQITAPAVTNASTM